MKDIYKRLPREFLERLEVIVPIDKLGGVLNAFASRRPTTFRVNTLKTDRETLRREFQQAGIKLEQVPWYRSAFILKNRSLKELKELKLYTEGYLYVQSLSSMIPALVLAAKPGERILDLAAAPGSKTTQMAALMQNKGEIVANDINPIRLEKLKANIEIQGVKMAKVTQFPAQFLGKIYPNYFDAVLVDAPCSGDGRINLRDYKSYKGWSAKKVNSFARLQRELLLSAIKTVKPGGRIVYSTCTLSPEENEVVIDWVMGKEKGKLRIEPISIPGLNSSPALTSWREQIYLPEIKQTIRILPSSLMEGFYIAKLRRLSA